MSDFDVNSLVTSVYAMRDRQVRAITNLVGDIGRCHRALKFLGQRFAVIPGVDAYVTYQAITNRYRMYLEVKRGWWLPRASHEVVTLRFIDGAYTDANVDAVLTKLVPLDDLASALTEELSRSVISAQSWSTAVPQWVVQAEKSRADMTAVVEAIGGLNRE